MKAFFGRLSDRLKERKIFVFSGYALSSLSKILIGLASGLTIFFASLIAGLLWQYAGVSAPFIFGATRPSLPLYFS